MRLRSKLALTFLAGALALPVAFAQGTALDPGTAPDQGGPGGPGGGPPGGGRMGPDGQGRGQGRGEGRGQGWRRDGNDGGQFRGMRGRQGRGGRREFMLARIADDPAAREKLGITTEQADKIRKETDDFRKGQIRGRADLQVKGLELRELTRGDNPDRAAIDKKLDEINAARLVRTKAEMHYRLDMRGMLTPEQRQKLRDMMAQRGGRGGRGTGPGQGGRPGGPPRGPRPGGSGDTQ